MDDKGYWTRIFVTAHTVEDADRVRLSAQLIFRDAVAVAPGDAEVTVGNVEVEWDSTIQYDADGNEALIWDAKGRDGEPPD